MDTALQEWRWIPSSSVVGSPSLGGGPITGEASAHCVVRVAVYPLLTPTCACLALVVRPSGERRVDTALQEWRWIPSSVQRALA